MTKARTKGTRSAPVRLPGSPGSITRKIALTQPTGDYGEDNEIGGALALEWLRWVAEDPTEVDGARAQSLPGTIRAMVERGHAVGEGGGLMIGFLSTIGLAVMFGVIQAPAIVDRVAGVHAYWGRDMAS